MTSIAAHPKRTPRQRLFGWLHRKGILRTVSSMSQSLSDRGAVMLEFSLIPHRYRPAVGAWYIRHNVSGYLGTARWDSIRVREHIRTASYHRIRYDVRWMR